MLFLAFDEGGGKLESVIPEELITTGATGKEEGAGKQSIFKGFFSGLKNMRKNLKNLKFLKLKQ